MRCDVVYNELVSNLSQNICRTWPEYAFPAACWSDLSDNAEALFKSLGDAPRSLPREVCVGYMDETTEGIKLLKIDGTPNMRITLMFDWCAYRGLWLTAENDMRDRVSIVKHINQIGSCILMRLLLSSGRNEILVHKVDPKGMGKDMMLIPQQHQAPTIVDKQGLLRLVNQIRSQIANQPVEQMKWRCDSENASFASAVLPLQIVYIANWNDLYDVRMDHSELSEVQKLIMDLLASDVAARNGIYFFICSHGDAQQSCFSGVMPALSIESADVGDEEERHEFHVRLSSLVARDKRDSAGFDISTKSYTCRCFLPTVEESQNILKVFHNYLNGFYADVEAEGIWQGCTSKGLRAVMGMTEQGSDQYFELGIGQGFDAFHALIGGVTGSGKSVLLSEIICSLAERYSPNELRMLLLDYKEGTEFAPFARLPHVYALSLGANPEFGLEVLKEVQKEISVRGRLFKEAGNSRNLDEYRKISGETLCRYVLIADEFQVLLKDKKYGEEARIVLNDLVRRGRSFGFHAILATQTLRDGALDGEARNQFGCRIAMKMAEGETDYFLGYGNTVPCLFNRKGQALVNYAMGRKENNIVFQSGNKRMTKKYRETTDVIACVEMLHEKAETMGCLPKEHYVYNSDGFAEWSNIDGISEYGILMGLRNNMQSTPFYLKTSQLRGKVLILGDNKEKQQVLLQGLVTQLGALYKEPVKVQTPEEYLNRLMNNRVLVLNVPEGDFDLEDALLEWNEQKEKIGCAELKEDASMQTISAPGGMEQEFAELMQALQTNQAAMSNNAPVIARRRNRDERCLVVAIRNAADIKLMESGGLFVRDFRTVIYLDNLIYNQVSGDYENSTLAEGTVLLESPRGVVSKIRLIKY